MTMYLSERVSIASSLIKQQVRHDVRTRNWMINLVVSCWPVVRHCPRYFCLSLLLLAPPASAADFGGESQEIRAQLSPQRYTLLSAELSAKISRITVKEGERFKKGQPLVRFDCALQKAQLDRAQAHLAGVESIWTGNKRLAELNAVGQVDLGNSEAEVMKARADIAYLKVTLDKCTLFAPYDGRVSEQKAREQQFVQAGQPLLDILDDSALELEFIVPSRWLTWLKRGHTFKVSIDDTNKTYPAKLLRISARADPVSQSIKAVAVIVGRHPELMSGMSGRILLAPDTAR